MNILDFLFPKQCLGCSAFGSYICAKCFTSISFYDGGRCLPCGKPSSNGLTHPICKKTQTIDGMFASLNYRGVIKKVIHRFKYSPYLTDLEKTLCSLFAEGIIQQERFYTLATTTKACFVPIPLHASRQRMRGYNQSEKLLKGLQKTIPLPNVNALLRVKNTTRQVDLSKTQRRANMQNAFCLHSKGEIITGYDCVFLIDDVVTSGATLLEAATVLKKAGVKHVYGLTLCANDYD